MTNAFELGSVRNIDHICDIYFWKSFGWVEANLNSGLSVTQVALWWIFRFSLLCNTRLFNRCIFVSIFCSHFRIINDSIFHSCTLDTGRSILRQKSLVASQQSDKSPRSRLDFDLGRGDAPAVSFFSLPSESEGPSQCSLFPPSLPVWRINSQHKIRKAPILMWNLSFCVIRILKRSYVDVSYSYSFKSQLCETLSHVLSSSKCFRWFYKSISRL